MLKLLALFIFLVASTMAFPAMAKDCGSSCETCYCTFRNGSTCSDDHAVLGKCTCRCTKWKKKSSSASSEDQTTAASACEPATKAATTLSQTRLQED